MVRLLVTLQYQPEPAPRPGMQPVSRQCWDVIADPTKPQLGRVSNDHPRFGNRWLFIDIFALANRLLNRYIAEPISSSFFALFEEPSILLPAGT